MDDDIYNPINVFKFSPAHFCQHVAQINCDQLYELIFHSTYSIYYNRDADINYHTLILICQQQPETLNKICIAFLNNVDTWDKLTNSIYGDEAIKTLSVTGQLVSGIMSHWEDQVGNELSLILNVQAKLARHCSHSAKFEKKFRAYFTSQWTMILRLSNCPSKTSLYVISTMCGLFQEDIAMLYLISCFCGVSAHYLPPESQDILSEFLTAKVFNMSSLASKHPHHLLNGINHVVLAIGSDKCNSVLIPAIVRMLRNNFQAGHQIFIAMVPWMNCSSESLMLLFNPLIELLASSYGNSKQTSAALSALYCSNFDGDTAISILTTLLKYLKNASDVNSKEVMLLSISRLSQMKAPSPELCGILFNSLLPVLLSTSLPRLITGLMLVVTEWVAPFTISSLNSISTLTSVVLYIISNSKLLNIPGFTLVFMTCCLVQNKDVEKRLISQCSEFVYKYTLSCVKEKSCQPKLLPLAYIMITITPPTEAILTLLERCSLFIDKTLILYKQNELHTAYKVSLLFSELIVPERRSTLGRFVVLLMCHRSIDVHNLSYEIPDLFLPHLLSHACELVDNIHEYSGTVLSTHLIAVTHSISI